MLAPHHRSHYPSIAEVLVAGSDVFTALRRGRRYVEALLFRRVARETVKKLGTDFGTVTGCTPGVAAQLPAVRAKAQIWPHQKSCAGPRGETAGHGAEPPPVARPPRPCSPRTPAHAWPTSTSAGTFCGYRRCAAHFVRRAATRRGRRARRFVRSAAVPSGGGRPRGRTEPLRGRGSSLSRENARDQQLFFALFRTLKSYEKRRRSGCSKTG